MEKNSFVYQPTREDADIAKENDKWTSKEAKISKLLYIGFDRQSLCDLHDSLCLIALWGLMKSTADINNLLSQLSKYFQPPETWDLAWNGL